MKFRKILSVVLIVMMVLTMAGCNYVGRPKGAGNNQDDISSKLKDLLIKTEYVYEPEPDDDENKEPTDDGNKDDEPGDDQPGDDQPGDDQPEPDPTYTPFTSTYDPDTLLSKIDDLIKKVKEFNGAANSATGVSDELLSGRTVKILVPDNFPVDEESEAIKAMSAQYNCSVIVKRVGTGSAYVNACRRAALSGDKADLMYVDNAIWGDVHSFTQVLDSYINRDLGDQLNTYTSSYTEKFFVADAFDATLKHYYVAAGIGAPFMLAFNKTTLKAGQLAESSYIDEEGAVVPLRAMEVTDPVAMYNERTWGINAFTAMLQANTVGSNVGLASVTNSLKGLDIWYGMEDAAGFNVDGTSTVATYTLTAGANKNVDVVQDWYWTTTGADGVNFVGDLVDASEWDAKTGSVYSKLFNTYAGTDAVQSYSFLACEVGDLVSVSEAATAAKAEWDFVAYPYGETYEDSYRALSELEFAEMVTADEEGDPNDPSFIRQVYSPAAGWCGGFAVLRNCENPSVALRVGEEFVKVWKAENETPAVEKMTDEQKARYEDMKENIGVSFVRGWAEKAADINEVYPNVTKYFNDLNDFSYANILSNGLDPEKYTNNRARILALAKFDGNADMLVAPMYNKYVSNQVYNPLVQDNWSDWAEGTPSEMSESAQDTASIMQILNASLLPTTIMFGWN